MIETLAIFAVFAALFAVLEWLDRRYGLSEWGGFAFLVGIAVMLVLFRLFWSPRETVQDLRATFFGGEET